ncbi:ADP-ribosyltransferase-containing protein [Eubacterium sp.]
MANNKKNKNVSNANSYLYELARKGAEARAFRQGQTVEQLKRDNANQVNSYNSAIDKYKKNGSIDKETASSLQKSFSRTPSYFSGDASTDAENDYSAVNLLRKQDYKNFVKSNNEMRGVASQLLNNYNDKKEFENYKHNRSDRERQAYREKRIAQAEEEYKNAKYENRSARKQALLHMLNDNGEGAKYEQTRTALAENKKILDDAKQWNYSETQADSLKTLQNDKELSKMIDIAARRKITKGIKTIDQAQAQNTTYADDVNEYITWKNYKKKLLNDGYTEKDIDNLVNARLAEINGEAYEGAAEFGKHAPVLAETFKLATAIPNEIANIGYSFDAAKGNTVVNPYSTASAGIKKGVGEYASKNGVNLRGLFDTKNNNILKVNDNNELIVFGKNQGDINKALYENIDQSATNIINSLVFGGGVTGGIIAKGASEKLRQAVINTAFSSGTMGEQLAEQLYNGDEASSAYRSALKDATVNWMSEMLGSPIEWANVNPKSTIGRAITSGVGEGLEEIIGNAMDRTWDATVNGKASEVSQKYQEYIKNGKSPKEATDLVLKDMVSDDLFAAMSAGLAGFAMGGGADVMSMIDDVKKTSVGEKVYANYNDVALIKEAKNINNATIKNLATEAEVAKSSSAKKKALTKLMNAVQEYNEKSYNDKSYNIVYEAVKSDSKSKEVAHQVADSIVNGTMPKNSSAKNYVHSIKNNDSRLAKRINDKLGAENYGATVRQQYVNDMTERHVGDFGSYTKGFATPQQLYDEATQKHNAEFKQQNKAMNDVAVKHFKKMEALVRLEENSQENIAKENESFLSNDTKNVLKDSEQVAYEAVSGISSVDNGVVVLDTKDGKKTALQNVDFEDNKKAEQLFKFSAFFGDGANTFVTNYFLNHDGEAPVDYFDKAKLAYKSGMERIEYSKVFGESTFGMTEEEAQSLYKAGLEQSNKLNAEIQNAKETKGKGVHVVGNVKLSNEQTHQLHFLSELVKGTSAQILVADSAEAVGLKNTNGYIDGDTIVVFAKESDKAVLSYAGHELTHYLKNKVSEDMYNDYHNFVIEHLKSKGEEHYNEIVERYAKAYGFDTDTQMNLIEEEMAADNALAVFSDEKALNTLAKDNRTLLQKVHDFFKQFAEKLKEIKQKLSKSSVVYSEVNHDIDFLEQSAEKIRTMLDNVQNVNTHNNQRFSLDVEVSKTDFESNIKKVANMESVKNLDGTEFSKSDTDLITQVTDYFNSIGNEVKSKYGTIKLTRIGVKSSIAHGIGRNKAIAFKAVPDVLKHGEIIDYTENYKNRGYDTAVFSAPFSINNEPFYMAAIVIVDDKVNEYYLHEVVIKKQNEDETPFKTGTSQKTTPSDASSSIYTLLEKLQNVNKQFSKNTSIDSEGNELTNEQQEYFKDSKVRDEDGNLLVVYHGSYEDFTVFDKTKGRANMDIQGSFFSPWEIDAGGYGPNVKAYYLNITNPADEQTGYKALMKYQGQNGAGIKAREYLESLGYDGVNNGNEEYIAFNSNQIKLIDNATPTNKSDIRYSRNTRLNYDENFDDVNDAFEQAIKVLQNVKGIDVSSELVEEVGKAQRNIDKELDGYHAQKIRNKNSVGEIARKLKSEYNSNLSTQKLTSMLADLYDYMANSDSTDMEYINSQAKIIANELINSSTSTVESDYKDIRKRIIDKSYSLTPETKKSLAEVNGSWREARQSFSSQLRINPKSDMSIERLYTDLSTDYPNLFDSSIVDEQEMLYAISNFVENNADTVVYNYQDELEQQGNIRGQFSMTEFENVIAGDIYDSFFDIEQVQKAVDKLDNKYKAQIASMREEMNDQKKLIRQQYRESYENKLAEYKNHAKGVQARKKERTDITVLKNRIRRLRMQIDRKLLKPSGNNYIPRGLVQSMAKVCDMLVDADMSSYRSQNTLSALSELELQYANLQNDPDYDYASEYSKEIKAQINELSEALKGKQLKELSKSEMQEIYDIVKTISTTLRNAKTLIDSNLKITAHQSAVELIKQQSKTKGKGRTPFGLFDYGLLNSMRYVNLISEGNKDGVLNILFDELNRGARKKDFLTMKWQKPFENLIREDNKSYREFREKLVDTPFVNVKGETVQLTESQIVQLIMTAKREQGRKHLAGGGFVAVDTKRLLKGKSGAKTKGNIVENTADTLIEQIVKLSNNLSPYAQKWMSLAENLFNNEVTKEVNNTSFMLKGYKIANEKYYIPLMADKDYTATQLEGVSMDKTIENAGFTKAVNVNAGNRIVIDGIDQVINRHIDTVSTYASLAVPIRNFRKVWNGQTSKYYDGEFLQDIDRQKLSVKEVIKNKWGDDAATLIENTVSDLQRSRAGHSKIGSIYNKILGNEISATFLGNLSIVLKQAASYPTAAAILSSDSLLKGSKGFAYIPSSKKLQALFDEIDEHTGAHYKRRIGMQTEELAALMRSAKGFQGKWLNSKLGMLHPAKWIQAMDVQTTAALWIASKYEIEKSKKFTEGSSEYWQAVTDLYDEVIEYTQPEYDVLHRAEIQKNTNPIARTFSLFQTQPLQNSGILYDGYREVMWAKQRLSEDNSEINKEALKQARTKQRKAVWAITSASATFAAFSFLGTFLVLHKIKKYRDDDDDVTAKSVLSAIGKETAETILAAYLPIIGSYAIDIGSRFVAGKESGVWYDYDYIDNMGLSAINDFLKASVKFIGTTGLAFKGDKTFKDVATSSKDFLVQIAQMNGVPATNTLNLYNSVTAYYKELIKHDCDLWDYNTQPMSSKDLLAKYVEYKNDGNGEKAKEFKQKWFKSNSDKTEKDFNSYIASYLAENEPKIAKAVQYRNELNTSKYESTLDSIIKKGYTKEIVDSAAQSVESKVKSTAQALFDGETDTYNDGIADLVKRGYDETSLKKYIKSIQNNLSESNGGNKVKGRYSTDELYRVWNSKGEDSAEYKTMYNDILNTKVANGMDKETAEKRIKTSIVDNYMDKSTDLQMAQKAYDQGNMQSYQYYINRVIATGKLSQEEVVKKARGHDPYKNSLWSATDYAKAIDQNDKAQADKIFKDLCKANGDVKSERQYVRGSTTSYFHKKYLEAKSKQEKSNIVAKLRKTGFYTQSEINNLRRKWDEAAKEE